MSGMWTYQRQYFTSYRALKAAMHYNAAAVIWDIGIAMMFVQRYILEKKYKYMDYYWIVCCGLTIVYYIIRMIYYTPAGFPI